MNWPAISLCKYLQLRKELRISLDILISFYGKYEVYSYFYVGKQVFRQQVGIPMGLDPAPFLANLFLAYYEIHFIDGLRKTDYGRAKSF